MRSFKLFIVFSFVALVLVTGCERKVTEQVIKEVSSSNAEYIGTDACQACHADIHASFVKTGHPFKVNDASDAFTPGYYPFTTLPTSGPELDLSQAFMVIGGFRWKARFIDSLGFIMTGNVGGAGVQYNFETDGWVQYHPGETKAYGNCGPCHMTAYNVNGGFQDGLPGLSGTWEANGIQCEECHGPGELHAGDPFDIGMVIDRSNEACGKCHRRGNPKEGIPASSGFVKHHEQWNEMFGSKHASIQCVDCHNVHESLHPLNPNKDNAINIDCESCHLKETQSFAASSINHANSSVGPDCVDCHMPRAAKSAVAVGSYEGDVRSHMFAINTSADAEMFTADGKLAIGDLTLEYTCLTCHDSKDKAWAADFANSVHAKSMNEADGFNGGQLYDKFWATETNFSPNRLDTAFTNNSNFYRCKGCHGWDLKGTAGAYINRGPNATRPNVSSLDLFSLANSVSADSLFNAIMNSSGRKLGEPLTDSHPDYSEILTTKEVLDIVLFLRETRIDQSLLYQLNTIGTYPTGSFSFSNLGMNGDATRGDAIYASTCGSVGCHGANGTAIDLGGRSVGKFLRDKAYEVQHKVRFGQLGSSMGSGFPYLSITELQDLYKALDDPINYPD